MKMSDVAIVILHPKMANLLATRYEERSINIQVLPTQAFKRAICMNVVGRVAPRISS
jgi:hypothetical protein